MNITEFRDLNRLAKKRTRDAAGSVIQLIDDDDQRAAVLVSVAIDFITGASILLADDDEAQDEALGSVFMMIVINMGVDKVTDALAKAKQWRAPT